MNKVLVCLLVVLCGAGAQAQECHRWDTPGCLQLRLTTIDATATRRLVESFQDPQMKARAVEAEHYVTGLVYPAEGKRRFASYQVSAAVYNFSYPITRKGEERPAFLKRADKCVPHVLMAWNVNTSAAPGIRESSQSYSGEAGKTPQVGSTPLRFSTLGNRLPQQVLRLGNCDGQAAFNIPWSWFTKDTFILICPEEPAAYPKPGDGKEWDGHHIDQEAVAVFMQQREDFEAGRRQKRPIILLTTVVNPVVQDEKKAS